MKQVLIIIIRIYQAIHGIFFHGCCRFQPCCSQYTVQALQQHGIVKGMLLAGMRLTRCHPLCRGGWDPVPVTFDWKRRG